MSDYRQGGNNKQEKKTMHDEDNSHALIEEAIVKDEELMMNKKSLIDEPIKPDSVTMTGNRQASNFMRFIAEMNNAHNRAVEKHPMTGMRNQDDCYKVDHLAEVHKLANDHLEKNSEYSWLMLLEEEIYEAVAEINKGDWGKAQAEAVQVAQVAFRMWLWCEEMKQKKKVK